SWSGLIGRYLKAFDLALAEAARRAPELAATALRPRPAVPVAPEADGRRPHLTRFSVAATLPEPLRGPERLARNYWWSWDAEATALLRELYPAKWEACRHNPTSFLRDIYPEDLATR